MNADAADSGPSTLKKDQIAERGARIARREERANREFVSDEQRSDPGCPAREVVLVQRGRATKAVRAENPSSAGRKNAAPAHRPPNAARRH